MPFWLILVVIGLLGGFAAGLFGVGGGIVIIPLLILLGRLYPAQSDRDKPGGSATPHWSGSRPRVLPSRQRRCPRSRHPRDHDDDRSMGGSLRREPHQRAAPEAGLRGFRVRHRDLSISSMEHASDSDGCRRSRLHRAAVLAMRAPGRNARRFATSYCGRAVGWGCGGCDSTAFGRSGISTFVASSPPASTFFTCCLWEILYLLLVGAIPQGYPAREAPPKGRIKIVRAAPGDDAGILGAVRRRVNTSCTRKVA